MSNIDFQKVADAVENSSDSIKNLMFSTDLVEKIAEIAEKNELDEKKFLNLIDEIGYVVIGIKSRFSFLESLQEIGLEKNTASKINDEIVITLFDHLDEIRKNSSINKSEQSAEKSTQSIEQKNIENNIGDSFEQLILNQAKAMQPARATEEVGRVMDYDTRDPKGEIPQNLPIVENEPKEEPRAIHNYIGNDPYREPTE